MDTLKTDIIEMNNVIHYFTNILSNNITTIAEHKIGATFIGIRTNISGKSKLHIYILLFPFMAQNEITPYPNKFQNVYVEDIHVNVDYSFYLWLYTEMQKQKTRSRAATSIDAGDWIELKQGSNKFIGQFRLFFVD